MIYTKKLTTKRCFLRQACKDDALSLFENWDSDIKMHEYVGYKLHNDVKETEKLIKKWQDEYPLGRLTWVIELRRTHNIIGVITASKNELEKKETEIGFSIGTKFQGNGYATETLRKVIKYLLIDCNLHIVKAGCLVSNIKSARTMEKVGMQEMESKDNTIKQFYITKDFL